MSTILSNCVSHQ
jgi:hypothetical protein